MQFSTVIADSYNVIFFAGFLLVVIFRYIRQNVPQKAEDGEAYVADKEQQQALLVAEPVDEKPQQALLVAV